MSNPKIFCALDTDDLGRAIELATSIGPVTGGLKLGLEFFNSFGPEGIEAVQKAAPMAAFFIDLKYYDIPNTVAGAVKALSQRIKPAYLNVHASGGLEMLRAAKAACDPATKLLGVTILTSFDEDGITGAGYQPDLSARVKQLALLTKEAGLDGVVCSAHEIEMLRETCGSDFILMTPGIRPASTDAQDQKRVMTPKRAIELGSSHLVIGRPITQSVDPAAAAQDIVNSLT